MKLHVVTFALAVFVVWASPARAEDGESALSVSLGYGTYSIPDHTPHGGALGLAYERGFSDALAWRLGAGGGAYRGGGQLSYSGHAVAGLTYRFDVLKYVPYAQLGVGGVVISGPEVSQVSPLVELGVGLDVLASRSFSYGVQVKFESFVQETSLFTAGLRLSWRWGFF